MDQQLGGSLVLRGCRKGYNVCRKREAGEAVSGRHRCIRKCCPDGQIYKTGPGCRDDFRHGLDFSGDKKVVDSEGEKKLNWIF